MKRKRKKSKKTRSKSKPIFHRMDDGRWIVLSDEVHLTAKGIRFK